MRRLSYSEAYHHYGCDDAMWVDPSRTRTRSAYPYSYDEFFIFGGREAAKGKEALYSDRIWQWDHDKASRCWKTHVGDRWPNAGAKKLSAFLSEYLGKPVTVCALAEGCNQGNGYPYWIVWFANDASADPSQVSANPIP